MAEWYNALHCEPLADWTSSSIQSPFKTKRLFVVSFIVNFLSYCCKIVTGQLNVLENAWVSGESQPPPSPEGVGGWPPDNTKN